MSGALEGRLAIVTGGARGIGREIAVTLARAGAHLALADILPDDLEGASREIEGLGCRVLAERVDVSRSAEVRGFVSRAADAFGRVDVLVNNAAYIHYAPFLEFEEAEWDRVMAVSLKGYFLCGQAAAREMARARRGVIINIASIAGEVGVPMGSAYCTAKGGVIALTRLMAAELAVHRIRVNAIAPGVVDTENVRRVVGDDGMKIREALVPLGRLGRTADVAKAALFLASDDAEFISGHILHVDGGFMATAVR
jgi:NAD(P)-dependent dehydrogenase (short-subunit alcohol dehydrogenase family)